MCETINIRLFNKKFQIQDGINFRQISAPKSKQHKLDNIFYMFDKEVVMKNEIYKIKLPISWTVADISVGKRVWNSLWQEGWR